MPEEVKIGDPVDLDRDPVVPAHHFHSETFRVIKHAEQGFWPFDPTKLDFPRINMPMLQALTRVTETAGLQLRLSRAGVIKAIANANLLDFFETKLQHTDLFKTQMSTYECRTIWTLPQRSVLFWGTIFYGGNSQLFIRSLNWRPGNSSSPCFLESWYVDISTTTQRNRLIGVPIALINQ